jgi:DNA-directed RNA polymerase specialized sigma24 family protein
MAIEPPGGDMAALVQKCAEGDHGAFNTLVRRHKGRMLRMARYCMRLHSMHEPAYSDEDSVQDTLGTGLGFGSAFNRLVSSAQGSCSQRVE